MFRVHLAAAASRMQVQGCASLGFDYADPKQRTRITLGQGVTSDADSPPAGAIRPITPALVQAQRNSLPPEVARLFARPPAGGN
jgi:polysaccharide biosynthesis/export protein